MLDGQQEFSNLQVGNSDLADFRSFWIGGSTNRPHNSAMNLTDYVPNEKVIIFLKNLLNC